MKVLINFTSQGVNLTLWHGGYVCQEWGCVCWNCWLVPKGWHKSCKL